MRMAKPSDFCSEQRKASLGMDRECFDCLEIVQKQSCLGHEQVILAAGKFPDQQIIRSAQSKQTHVLGVIKLCTQQR